MPNFELCQDCVAEVFCSKSALREKWCPVRDKLDRALVKAQIPKRFLQANFYNYKTVFANREVLKILREVDKILQKEVGIVYFYGEPFSGKTYNAFVLLNHYIYENCLTNYVFEHPIAYYTDFVDMLDKARSQEWKAEFEILKTVPLLLIDDVGSIITDQAIEVFYRVINERYKENLSTILTSLYSINELEKLFGKRVVSRIRNMLIAEIECQYLEEFTNKR